MQQAATHNTTYAIGKYTKADTIDKEDRMGGLRECVRAHTHTSVCLALSHTHSLTLYLSIIYIHMYTTLFLCELSLICLYLGVSCLCLHLNTLVAKTAHCLYLDTVPALHVSHLLCFYLTPWRAL